MFLIRAAFWLSIVILLLPTGPSDDGQAPVETVSASDAFGIVGTTVQDLAHFCERNAQTCEAGSEALKTFGAKAEFGARTVYDYISDLNRGETGDMELRPSIDTAGSDTLTNADRAPDWRGPVDTAI